MHALQYLAAAAALVTSTIAQTWENDMATDSTRRPVSASLMNITFSDANSRNCGNDSSNSLTIAIRTIPQDRVCFNLGNTFSDPTATYSMRGLDCKDNTICGVNYTIIASDFSTSVNYSQIGYTQISNPFAEEEQQRAMGGRLEFHAYNAANCKEDDGVRSRGWDCLDEDVQCSTMPFAVQSFSVAMTDPKDVGQSSCAVAKVSGAERLAVRPWGTSGGVAVVAGLILGFGYLL